jgi:hypothetical protein
MTHKYYDEWVPRHDFGQTSARYGEGVNFDITFSYTKGQSFSFDVGIEAGPVSMTLFQFTSASEAQESKTVPFSGTAAGGNEKIRIVPLVKRRTIIDYVQVYNMHNGSNTWTAADTYEERSQGFLKETNYAVFKFDRKWLDEDNSEAGQRTRSEPADNASRLNSLLGFEGE